MKTVTILILIAALLSMPVHTHAQVNTAPPGTPLSPLWPLVPATLNSTLSTLGVQYWMPPTDGRFYIGDFVCLDTLNTPASSGGLTQFSTIGQLYVFDNGKTRCPPGQPQVGIVAQQDPVSTTTHKVYIQLDLDRTIIVSPLGGPYFPSFFLQPCNPLTVAITASNNQCFQ